MSVNLLLQVACAVLGVTGVVLNAREKVIARPVGIVGAIMSSFIYYPAGLYAKCLLNGIFLVLNLYGWYWWLYGGTHKTHLQISRTSPLTLMRVLLAGLIGTVALGSLLYRYSHADLPYWDSLHTAMCLTAQWMLVNKKLENWAVWMVADVLYLVVLYQKGLYIFSGLHVCYACLAIYGYRTWRQSYQEQREQVDIASSTAVRDI
jgi:nicotinamide mononucleotide transporter